MINLYNDDCLNILKQLKDKSVDLIVTDPPYEMNVDHDGGKLFASKNLMLNKELPNLNLDKGYDLKIIGKELIRVLKYINIYVWCNKLQLWKYFEYYVGELKCGYEIICWHKSNALPTYGGKYLTDTEYCLYFFEKGHKLCHHNKYEDAKTFFVEPINIKDKKLYKHPTIKPLNMMERFIMNSSNEKDVVLDPFMGSGTTGVACKKLNRDFIGIEINNEYFKIAEKRINSIKNDNINEIFDL